MIRKIIKIDEGKCDGCSLCVNACHEGAIGLVEGKAKLLRDDYCDGLGDCLPVCPTGAIRMKERKRKGNVVSVPKFKARKCDHCQACMQLCPKRAIKYFRIKPQSPRYLHHDVTLNELIKRD